MDRMTMEHFIRSGFDTLELAYQAAVPAKFINELRNAKNAAQILRGPVPVCFNDLNMVVEPRGTSGFTYCVSKGREGAIYRFRDRPTPAQWDVHVKTRAYGLATKGLLNCKSECDDFLSRIGVSFDSSAARVSRADYAFDFVAPELDVETDHFLCHARTRKEETFNRTLRGDQVCYARVGVMPGKQVCIYDKSQKVRNDKDHLFADIFQQACVSSGITPIEGGMPKHIWRIELRAGKDYIDSVVKPRRWDMFLPSVDLIFQGICNSYTWRAPCNDINRSRWPQRPMWTIIQNRCVGLADTSELPEISEEAWMKMRRDHYLGLEAQLRGRVLTAAAIQNVPESGLPAFSHELISDFALGFDDDFNWTEEAQRRRAKSGLYKV